MTRRACSGLSLVEIVVAGLLALLAVNTMIAPLASSHRAAQQGHSRLDALRVAGDLVALARAQPFAEITNYAGTRTIESGNSLKVYLYRVDIATPFPHFKQVRIQVRWHERGCLRTLEHATGLQGEAP